MDPDFARQVGLPRNILHGLYTMALVARANAALADGDPRALKRLKVQFRGMGVPEEEITVTGTVTPGRRGNRRGGYRSRAGRQRDHPQRRGRVRVD
ncbi:MAG: MaoC/PaaZ C-terminal domain-containing protein [Thermoleophilaceae bacterium]